MNNEIQTSNSFPRQKEALLLKTTIIVALEDEKKLSKTDIFGKEEKI